MLNQGVINAKVIALMDDKAKTLEYVKQLTGKFQLERGAVIIKGVEPSGN